MKKLCLSILASLALTLGLVSQVQADEYLRIGMEADLRSLQLDSRRR